ncbi:MAG: hypothetical protein JRI68_07020 [Deltaproteobacteria bacterium]|nr:hypothetical protein [Deltaproteobacteria bacterium]
MCDHCGCGQPEHHHHSGLLPHVDFDLEASLGMIRDIHPGTTTIVTSAQDGGGMEELATQLLTMWS